VLFDWDEEKAKSNLQLDPDVAAIFPDSGAVNEGLRLLMRLIQQAPAQPGTESITVSKEA